MIIAIIVIMGAFSYLAWHVGYQEGYNQATEDIRENLDEM